jgi:cell shape-determining protein MreC
MNIMDDEERDFEIKTRIRLSNKMKAAIHKLDTEVKRLREENKRLREMVEKAVGYGAYDEEYRGEEE